MVLGTTLVNMTDQNQRVSQVTWQNLIQVLMNKKIWKSLGMSSKPTFVKDEQSFPYLWMLYIMVGMDNP